MEALIPVPANLLGITISLDSDDEETPSSEVPTAKDSSDKGPGED